MTCEGCGWAGPRVDREVNYAHEQQAWLCRVCFFEPYSAMAPQTTSEPMPQKAPWCASAPPEAEEVPF
jgi:hypothetical protein